MRDKALTIRIINAFDNQINNKPYTTPDVPAAYSQTPDQNIIQNRNFNEKFIEFLTPYYISYEKLNQLNLIFFTLFIIIYYKNDRQKSLTEYMSNSMSLG